MRETVIFSLGHPMVFRRPAHRLLIGSIVSPRRKQPLIFRRVVVQYFPAGGNVDTVENGCDFARQSPQLTQFCRRLHPPGPVGDKDIGGTALGEVPQMAERIRLRASAP